MVEKMKFISIVGPKEEIDRVTSQYLSGRLGTLRRREKEWKRRLLLP